MAYLSETETNKITEDIIKRKEFYEFKIDHEQHDHQDKKYNIIPRFMIEKMIRDGRYLQFSSYQNFVKNYINPNTPYSRLLMKHETGTGKTLGSLGIAMNFINYYKKEFDQGDSQIGSVFIIGFTSAQFKEELLRFPELGFITRSELDRLKQLRSLIYTGFKQDIVKLQEFLMRIRKRFSNREGNGFFQFIGYKKLVNMIFIIKDPKINISNMDEDSILQAIKDKKIQLNKSLLEQFKNSLLICDEIHNTYNSAEKNNWGVALQYILNYHSSVRALFLSATPINNSPTEIVDLLNMLLPNKHYSHKLKKSDFFDNNQQLKRCALDRIANLSRGRISYLRDVDPKNFPTKKFIGESIEGAPYLKFIRCPMSNFHYNTYKEVYKGSLTPESQYLVDFAIPNPKNSKIGLYQTSEIKKELPYASQQWKDANKINFKKDKIIGDILRLQYLPHISNKFAKMMEVILNNIKNQCGKMFIYHNIIHMSGVLFIQEILLQNNIIGEFASSTANTLCAICGKYRKDHTKEQLGGGEKKSIYTRYNNKTRSHEVYLNDDIPILEYVKLDNIIFINSCFINHNRKDADIIKAVKMLMSNNYIIMVSSNNKKVNKILQTIEFKICSNKGKFVYYIKSPNDISEKDQKNLLKKFINYYKKLNYKGGSDKKYDKNHTYMPVRFIVIHSQIDRVSINASLDKYNSPDNSDGARIMILVGGKLIKEAFDIKAVREMMVMGRPDNIPTLIQILGRAVRKGSHNFLHPNERHVNIRIFTSCLPIKKNGVYMTSYEEDKYMEKLKYYKVIQNIEKTMHENAIDSVINKNIIWPKEERDFYKKHKNYANLGPLYFEPNVSKNLIDKTFTLNELNLETFHAFHSNEEIYKVIMIIKRLFIEKSTIWTYKDLLYAARNCQKWFVLEFNTKLIEEKLFIVALTRLLWTNDIKFTEPIITHANQQIGNVIDKIFDSDDKIITLPGNQDSIITQVGQYYILFPIDQNTNQPIKDLELPYRINKKKESAVINIKQILESGQSLIKYSDKRDRFFTKWNNVQIENLELVVCDFGTDFHIAFLEECIEYVFNVWTDHKLKKSFMHSFYFKMLNYYDLRKLVIWGHTVKPYMFKKYASFLNPINIKIKKDTRQRLENIDTKNKDLNLSGLINMLKSSINKSDLNWISSGLKKHFNENLTKSLKLFDGNYKKSFAKGKKVDADLVPIGHFLNYIPKFYHPNDKWFESPEYLESTENFTENNIIIGYDERSKTGVYIRFKIRTPIQNIKQYKDSRMIEKGSVCSSKNKVYLKEIADKIGIKIKGKINVPILCNDIRTKLIYLELKERIAKTNKKWFYFIYERRPETILDDKK